MQEGICDWVRKGFPCIHLFVCSGQRVVKLSDDVVVQDLDAGPGSSPGSGMKCPG